MTYLSATLLKTQHEMKEINITNFQKALVLAFRRQDVKRIKRTEYILLRRLTIAKNEGLTNVNW